MHRTRLQLLIAVFSVFHALSAGATPLTDAALEGKTKKVIKLLDQGADVNQANEENVTALQEAINNDHLDTVKVLLERGASIHYDWVIRMSQRDEQRKSVDYVLPMALELQKKAAGVSSPAEAAAAPAAAAPSQAAQAPQEDCEPFFYRALPRDRDWYYGTAKNPDMNKAREHAIRNLGRQVTGDLDGWGPADIDKIAGPGHDRSEVAQNVGKLLPQSSLLAGWEQDDGRECNGMNYALVRIEKEQVAKYLKENQSFKSDLAATLTKRVEKVETAVAALQVDYAAVLERLSRLEKLKEALPPAPSVSRSAPEDLAIREDLQTRITAIKADMAAGLPPREVEKKVVLAEGVLDKLSARLKEYDAKHQRIKDEKVAAFKAENDAEVAGLLAKVRSGPVTYQDVDKIANFYQRTKQEEAVHSFYHDVAKLIEKNGVAPASQITEAGLKEAIAYDIFRAAYSAYFRTNKDEVVKDGEAFLQAYPNSRHFSRVSMNMKMLVRGMQREKRRVKDESERKNHKMRPAILVAPPPVD